MSFKRGWEQHPLPKGLRNCECRMSRRHLGLSDQAREASNLLAAVYGWFTEVFETLDLKEAKAPLEELAS